MWTAEALKRNSPQLFIPEGDVETVTSRPDVSSSIWTAGNIWTRWSFSLISENVTAIYNIAGFWSESLRIKESELLFKSAMLY